MYLNIIKSILLNRLGAVQSPSFITYLTTWRCNGRCIFCDIWKRDPDKADELTPEEVGTLFQQFAPVDVLRITGGEPFLRTDLAQVIDQADQACSPGMIHLTSNGLLTKRILKVANTVSRPDRLHIKISIDSVGTSHDEVRGVPGIYEKAMDSVRGLVRLRGKTGLHVGVNMAIVNEDELDRYFELSDILEQLKVPIYPVIAHKPTSTLYSGGGKADPSRSVEPFGTFSEKGLERFRELLDDKNKEIGDLKETLVDRYHVKGLYNRLVKGKDDPNPSCVALNNHLRILPNGDIPVCLFNAATIGNLREAPFNEIWKSAEAKAQRKWVGKCRGCWQSCESIVSAIYTGDIWRSLFM